MDNPSLAAFNLGVFDGEKEKMETLVKALEGAP